MKLMLASLALVLGLMSSDQVVNRYCTTTCTGTGNNTYCTTYCW